jgi:hypothetical protein
MHILHWVAVKVDDDLALDNPIGVLKENACYQVNSTLEGDGAPYLRWTDWWMIGGGRFTEGAAYESKRYHAIPYHEDSEKFLAKINEVIGWRKDEAQRQLDQLNDQDPDGEFDFTTQIEKFIAGGAVRAEFSNHQMWLASNLAKLALGYWTPDARFYDITNGTDSPNYILADIEKGDGFMWVLVPVDFHY